MLVNLILCLEGTECRHWTRSRKRSTGSAKRSRASMLSVKSSPASSTNWRQPSVCFALQHGHAGEKDVLSQNADHGSEGGGSSETTRAPAQCERKISYRQPPLAEPQRSGSCLGNWQDAARNHRCMQRRSPEPCRRRDCPTQAGRPRRRARWEALCHTAERDGATRRGLRRDKKSVGRLRKEPVVVFASLRCSVDRASPSERHKG